MKTLITFCLLSFISMVHAQTGCLSGNCYTGVGTYRWDTGDEYTGEWVNGIRNGVGCYDWRNGAFYYGYFEDGKLEGDGIYLGTEASEDKIGIFHDGKLSEAKNYSMSGCIFGDCVNGVGVFLWTTDDMFIGEWKDGSRTGYGRYDWADGSFYTGYLKDNLLNGEGYYRGKDKKVMTGTFVDGQFQSTER